MTWETSLAEMLDDLSSIQEELLQVLNEKRENLASSDAQGSQQLQDREQQVCRRLEDFRDRRAALLSDAKEQGLPSSNLAVLAAAAKRADAGELEKQVAAASHRMRILQQHSLTNWVIAQRSLLHVSQLLEIIATGGRLKPTYGKGKTLKSSGALVDQEA